MPRRSRLTLVAATTYGMALLLVGLWPSHVDHNIDVIGSPPVQWMVHHFSITAIHAYDIVEFSANIALFAPFGVFAMTWSRHSHWVYAVLSAFMVSGAVEIFQDVARPNRTASWMDIVANTCGAGLGTASVVVWRLRQRRKLRGVTDRR